MARPSLQDIRAVTSNILTSNDYVLNLGVVPGSGMSQSKGVMLKCTSLSLPKIEIETLEVDIRGFKTIHRGIKRFSGNTFTCDFYVSGGGSLLAMNGDSYQLIYSWMQFIANTKTGAGQPGKKKFFTAATGNAAFDNASFIPIPNVVNNTKAAYSVDDVVANIYNTSGDLALRFELSGVFPVGLEGLDFENSATEKSPLKVRATFAFDTIEASDILTTKAINLANKAVDKLMNAIPGPLKSAFKTGKAFL